MLSASTMTPLARTGWRLVASRSGEPRLISHRFGMGVASMLLSR